MKNYLILVEDDLVVGPLYQQVLEAHGYIVKRAVDAESALVLISQTQMPDILVLDYAMPAYSGEWLLDQLNLRGIDRSKTRVIGFSSFPADAEFIQSFKTKCDAYGQKPFTVEALLRTILTAC